MQNRQVKIKEKFHKLKETKLDWRGYSAIIAYVAAAWGERVHFFFDALRRRSLGEPCGETAGYFFFFLGVGLVDGIPAGVVILGWVGLCKLSL